MFHTVLIRAHIVLISVGILFSIGMAVQQFHTYRREGGWSGALHAGVFAIAAIVLALYLKSLFKKTRDSH